MPISDAMDTKELKARYALISQIANHFSLEELDELAFESGINPEMIAGETISERARELVSYAERRGSLGDVIRTCQIKRPLAGWE